GHDAGDEVNGTEELLVGLGHLGEILRLGHRRNGHLLEVTREPLGQLLCARLPLGPQYHGRVEVFLAEDLPDLLTFGPDFGAECRLRAAHDADDHALPRAERKHVAYLERFLVSIATKLAGQSFAEDGL